MQNRGMTLSYSNALHLHPSDNLHRPFSVLPGRNIPNSSNIQICIVNSILPVIFLFHFSPNQDIQLNAIALINSLFMRAVNKKVSYFTLSGPFSPLRDQGIGRV